MNWIIKTFNELSINELYNILKVRNQVFVVEQDCPYQDCDDKDRYAYHLFLELEGEILAYLRIVEKGISYDEISIGRVLTSQGYRGKNYGRQIMLKALDFIENSLKGDAIRISAQYYLIDFYKSLGFKEVSQQYLEDDIPHIEMLYNAKR